MSRTLQLSPSVINPEDIRHELNVSWSAPAQASVAVTHTIRFSPQWLPLAIAVVALLVALIALVK